MSEAHVSNEDTIQSLTEKIAESERQEEAYRERGDHWWVQQERSSRANLYYPQRAVLYLEQGQQDRASADHAAATALGYPPDVIDYTALGRRLFSAGDYGRAAQVFRFVLDRISADPEHRHGLDDLQNMAAACTVQQAILEYRQGSRSAQSLVQVAMKALGQVNPAYYVAEQLWNIWAKEPAVELPMRLWDTEAVRRPIPQGSRVNTGPMLAFIVGWSSWVGSCSTRLDDLVLMVRSDPSTARDIAMAWSPADQHYPDAMFLVALVAYESRDQAEVERVVRSHLLGRRWWTTLWKHPVVLLADGYSRSQADGFERLISGEPVAAFAQLSKCDFDRALGLGGIAEVLRRAAGRVEVESQLTLADWQQVSVRAEVEGDFAHAGEWYEKAAKVAEAGTEPRLAADAYLAAARCFAKAHDLERSVACQTKAGRSPGQPDLQITWTVSDTLVVQEWDLLTITIANIGFAPARNIVTSVEGPVTTDAIEIIPEIAAGETRLLEIAFRPENAGRVVPVAVKMNYEDSEGTQILTPISKRLQVLRPNESSSGTGVKDGMA